MAIECFDDICNFSLYVSITTFLLFLWSRKHGKHFCQLSNDFSKAKLSTKASKCTPHKLIISRKLRDTDTRNKTSSPAGRETRLFTYATRTVEGANQVLDFVQEHSHSLELHTLLKPSAVMDTLKMPVRCFTVLNGQNEIKEIEVKTPSLIDKR